jgi:hypothetical protein
LFKYNMFFAKRFWYYNYFFYLVFSWNVFNFFH